MGKLVASLSTQVWIFLGNEEVRERADGEGELARLRNKKNGRFHTFPYP